MKALPQHDTAPKSPFTPLVLELGRAAAMKIFRCWGERQNHSGSGLEILDPPKNGIRGIFQDLSAAGVAVEAADLGIKKAEVIVDFSRRPDRRSSWRRTLTACDGHGRLNAVDQFGVRFFELFEELACSGRKALDVPALSLRVKGIDRQGALSASRQSAQGGQFTVRYIEVDCLEIVDRNLAQANRVGAFVFYHRLDLNTGFCVLYNHNLWRLNKTSQSRDNTDFDRGGGGAYLF